MVRILLAGIVGGLLIFVCGAIAHVGFNLESRKLKDIPQEQRLMEMVEKSKLEAGIYAFPGFEEGMKLSGPDRTQFEKDLAVRYKKGPSGILLVAPTGEEPMGGYQLGGELVSNWIIATLAAWIMAHFSTAATFLQRWLGFLLLAPISWFSLSDSYHLWYRFPQGFILDGLIVALVEWGVAGLAMAFLLGQNSVNKEEKAIQ